jgi:adenosylcobinamide-phosphate synthase
MADRMLLDSPGWVLSALLTALAADALFGEPPWLYRRLPHPVVLIGRAIAGLERLLLDPGAGESRKRAAGVLLLAVVAGGACLVATAVHLALRPVPMGWLAEGLLLGTLLAQRSLIEHVAAVARGLRESLPAGRRAVAMIVGRDPERLDEAGVGRAAIESLAENLSDGVMAPLFWAAVAGLPGILAYKAVNTLDSMVGHRSERYRAFGWASARFDDLVNLVPARLTGGIVCLAGALGGRCSLRGSLRIMRRDAPRHRSPNAGWPEAAMAAVLGLRLNGPRAYGGVVVADAWMGDGRSEAGPADIDRAIRLAWAAWWVAAGLVAAALLVALSL